MDFSGLYFRFGIWSKHPCNKKAWLSVCWYLVLDTYHQCSWDTLPVCLQVLKRENFRASEQWTNFLLRVFPNLSGIFILICAFIGQVFREGNGTQLQYFCLENPMHGVSWWATVHGVVKSQTPTERLHFQLFTFMHWRRKWQPTPVFLPGESQGWRSLVGCCLCGHTESTSSSSILLGWGLIH